MVRVHGTIRPSTATHEASALGYSSVAEADDGRATESAADTLAGL